MLNAYKIQSCDKFLISFHVLDASDALKLLAYVWSSITLSHDVTSSCSVFAVSLLTQSVFFLVDIISQISLG